MALRFDFGSAQVSALLRAKNVVIDGVHLYRPRTDEWNQGRRDGPEPPPDPDMTSSAPSVVAVLNPPGAVRVTGQQMGIVAGILAVTAGTFFEVRPPEAYGVCIACHGRDLVDWTVNAFFGTHLTVAPASLVFPVLTTIGVLLGALVAATMSGEFRWWSPRTRSRRSCTVCS